MLGEKFYSRRSTVLARHAAVATSNPIASEVGLSLLKNGANAAEAAVGIAAVLSLVDPGMTGLGGDCFVLFYDNKLKTVKGINGSGRSPKKLTIDMLSEQGISVEKAFKKIPRSSAFSVMVPGAAAAWIDCVEKFGSGKKSFEDIFSPAIQLAENGFFLHEVTATLNQQNYLHLKTNDTSYGSDLLVNGKPPTTGQIVRNQKFAKVLKDLAINGKEGFYKGRIAEEIVKTVQGNGGCLTMEDMESHCSTFDEPIFTDYRGFRVWEMPPNGQGVVPLMTLNILEGYNIEKEIRMSSSLIHKLIESTNLAFEEGFKYISDPLFKPNSVEPFLSKKNAEEKRRSINLEKASQKIYSRSGVNSGTDTVYFSVVDNNGNACSFINSNYYVFGSGLVPKDCGFALQNRASNFSLCKSHGNCVGPRKRSYHTIIPAMVTHSSNNDLFACFGVTGGFMQPQGHVQVLLNLIDFGMSPQNALCHPRCYVKHYNIKPHTVYLEEGIPEKVFNELKALGHNVVNVSEFNRLMFGQGQVIQVRHDEQGNRVLWCGSESRADGCALGY
ncbi:glutathione hydrolase-like YwrD proenzyme isoform X1 [Hydra vulgaris]|uniref:glutathione hydrolase-like YwrD proenzyme isoform X1 n=1 Tax=Hydra vulgaris TaxID=6087 RepID=UPI001F5F0AB2|nr:glutathione hydrolase-like YwrD proenzyme [Hydra vulgaris]